MSRRVLVAVVVALAVVSGGALFVGESGLGGDGATPSTGEGVSPQGTESGDGGASETTEAAGQGPVDGVAARATAGPGYNFTIERVDDCGRTCRDVTARLSNGASTTRRNVRLTTRVYAGGDLLWSGNESVGTLAPGGSHDSTRRVQVGVSGALKINANGGWITIVTVVESADGTARFVDRRKVA